MNAANIKPVLILLTSLFILFMLSGCVVAPYPEPVVVAPPPRAAVVVRPAPAYYYHPGPYWRRPWYR
jgi:hypothetical protein